ncbi:MAG: hypothetical protein R2734_02585 [Nocardioides sp.]
MSGLPVVGTPGSSWSTTAAGCCCRARRARAGRARGVVAGRRRSRGRRGLPTCAYRELAEEDRGQARAPPALSLWREFELDHAAYGRLDRLAVFVAATPLADDDIVLGRPPDRVRGSAAVGPTAGDVGLPHVLPHLLASPEYAALRGEEATMTALQVFPVPAGGAEDVVVVPSGPGKGRLHRHRGRQHLPSEPRRPCIERVAHTQGRPWGWSWTPTAGCWSVSPDSGCCASTRVGGGGGARGRGRAASGLLLQQRCAR